MLKRSRSRVLRRWLGGQAPSVSRAVVILILGGGLGRDGFLTDSTAELSSPSWRCWAESFPSRLVKHSHHTYTTRFGSGSIDYGGVGVGEHTALVPCQYMEYTAFLGLVANQGGYVRGPREPAGGTELWREPEVLLRGGHQASSVPNMGHPSALLKGTAPTGTGQSVHLGLNGEATQEPTVRVRR